MSDTRFNHALLTWRRLVRGLGEAASWIYFCIGIAVAYEVVSRYFFNSPTAWVEEISRVGMVWATFALLAPCLNHRQMISITLLYNSVGRRVGLLLDLLQLLAMIAVGALVGWFAFVQMVQSIEMGRATATSMSLPYWIFHLALVIGFALLGVQAILEMIWICLSGERLFDKKDSEDAH
ncbi:MULTISPECIES: TRAP transporter small permease [unclassified Halomonas]|uniref:TRAP transporter small permease n=1 Tax=unclassified Halomonas TaxID=2609666 RepID=UPI004034AE69